jgi:hypothetical protein
MDQGETERLIRDALSDHGPDASLHHCLKGQSTRAFARGQRLRLWYRHAAAVCVVTLIAAGAFLLGRCCMPGGGPAGDKVIVSRDLVTWIEAGRFFARLGMPEREARAYQEAGRLAEEPTRRVPVAQVGTSLGELLARCDTAGGERTDRSVSGVNGIMAHVSGGLNDGH